MGTTERVNLTIVRQGDLGTRQQRPPRIPTTACDAEQREQEAVGTEVPRQVWPRAMSCAASPGAAFPGTTMETA